MKIIRSVDELPFWFKLSKYEGASSLTALGWYEQLTVRKDLLSLAESPRWRRWEEEDGSIGNADRPTVQNTTVSSMEMVRDTPIFDIHSNEFLFDYYFARPRRKRTAGVRLTTPRELYIAESMMSEEQKAFARNLFSGDAGKSLFSVTGDAWVDEPIDLLDPVVGGGEINLRVKMSLPDSVLIKEFKTALKSLRNSKYGLNVMQSPRKADFDRWVGFGVLPYLDLRTWAATIGSSIPNRVLADAIFPPGEGGEEVVRKTTKKLVDDVLSIRSLMTLFSSAMSEGDN